LGDETAADASFKQHSGLNDSLHFYLGRSQLQLRVGQAAKAEHDVRAAIDLDKNSAWAWFLLGQALELKNKPAEAFRPTKKPANWALRAVTAK